MAEEAKSIPWLKVFGGMGLSGIWGKVKSRVEVGTKYHIGVSCVYKKMWLSFYGQGSVILDNKIIIGHLFCQLRLNKGKSIQ